MNTNTNTNTNLKRMDRFELDQRIKSLILKERELLHEILMTIKEIDGRRLYLEMGYPNLFSYLTEGVGYSAGSAQRRIDAARLIKEIPEIGAKLKSGEIHLSQISLMQKSIRTVQKSNKTKQVISVVDKKELLEQIVNKNHQETQKAVASFFDLPVLQFESKKVQADESIRIELTLSKELADKLNLAQELLSHSLPDKDLTSFLEYVSMRVIQQKTGLKKVTPKKKVTATVAVEHEAAHSENSSAISKLRKHIPAAVRKQVLTQTAVCNYQDPITHKKCNSRWHLQVDHIQAKWSGGDNGSQNLQALCGNHNRLKYRHSQNIQNLS